MIGETFKLNIMKKTISVLLSILPLYSYAQSMAPSNSTNFTSILIYIIIIVIVFLLIRELVCWYYKINLMVKNQSEIIRLLTKIANKNDSENNEVTDNKLHEIDPFKR